MMQRRQQRQAIPNEQFGTPAKQFETEGTSIQTSLNPSPNKRDSVSFKQQKGSIGTIRGNKISPSVLNSQTEMANKKMADMMVGGVSVHQRSVQEVINNQQAETGTGTDDFKPFSAESQHQRLGDPQIHSAMSYRKTSVPRYTKEYQTNISSKNQRYLSSMGQQDKVPQIGTRYQQKIGNLRLSAQSADKFAALIPQSGLRQKSMRANDIIFKSHAESSQMVSGLGSSPPRTTLNRSSHPEGSRFNRNQGNQVFQSTNLPQINRIGAKNLRLNNDSRTNIFGDDQVEGSQNDFYNTKDSFMASHKRKRDLIQKAEAIIDKPLLDPKQIAEKMKKHDTLLQQKRFKQWFKSRGIQNAHAQYYFTGAEVKADNIIDDMFEKLDADGGGTLDFGEITALFKQNGIHMTEESIANMFGEAARLHKLSHYRKMVQDGFVDKLIPSEIEAKSLDYYMSQNLDPEKFKMVAKSPAALKKFKQELKAFRDEMTRKKQLYYIPVTMDELMARFVTNMERQQCKNRFKENKGTLMGDTLKQMDREIIKHSVEESINALKDLIGSNSIDMERQPNSENKLYLSIMERIQDQEQFKLINMKSTKECNVVRMGKPSHLAALALLAKALKSAQEKGEDPAKTEQEQNLQQTQTKIEGATPSPNKEQEQ